MRPATPPTGPALLPALLPALALTALLPALLPALTLTALTLTAAPRAGAAVPNNSFATAIDFQDNAFQPGTERFAGAALLGDTLYYTFGVASPGRLAAALSYSSSGFETGPFALYDGSRNPLGAFSPTAPLSSGVYFLTLTITGVVGGGQPGDGRAGNSAFQWTLAGAPATLGGATLVPASSLAAPAVPEPSPRWLLLAGLAPLARTARRRRRAA